MLAILEALVKEHLHDGIRFQKIDPLFLLQLIGGVGLLVKIVIIFDPLPGQDLKAPVFHALQHGYGVPLVDLAGAGAALDGHGRAGAVEGHGLGVKGQRTVIFQQHHNIKRIAKQQLQADILEKTPPDILVMGNIDPVSVLRHGDPKKVSEETRALLEKCARYPNFVISSGCDMPPMTPWENIDAFFAATDNFYKKA